MAEPLVQLGSVIHDGRALSYEVHGRGDRVVVYLHGLLLDSNMNRGVARALAERGYRVVLPDLLGHGRSDKPTHASEYRMDLYVDQVLAVMDDLGVAEAVLGGMSLGANVSLLTAARAPARVKGLIIEMPVLEWAVPAAALLFVPLLLLLHYADRPVGLVTGLLRRLPRTGSGLVNALLDAGSLRPDAAAAVLHGILVGPIAPTIDERNAVTVPTLVLSHRADLIHPLSDAANLARQLPDARLLRARSPLELRLRPRRLTAEIAGFLDDLWARREPSGSRREPSGSRRPVRPA